MILPIVAFGAPVLRKKCVDITPEYPELETLLANMWETMYEACGVGLAAPQINKGIRLFLIDTTPFVEDEEEIEETIIESTETDQEEIVEEVEVMEEEIDMDIPFAIIEDVPLFPGCERVAKSKRRDCFQKQMNKHIVDNFRYPEIAQEMGIQGRVFVQFMIGKDGSISGIRTRGPDKNLEKEANRIISKLPKMTPGKQRGRPVRVPFSIPIQFKLQ